MSKSWVDVHKEIINEDYLGYKYINLNDLIDLVPIYIN